MANAPFFNVFEQSQAIPAPVVKTHRLAAANLEKLVAFQFNALQSYVDLGIGRLKAAAEVNDPKSLQAFVSAQVEAANAIRQKLLEDTKALADLNTGLAAEFNNLVKDSVAELTAKVTKRAA